MIAWASLAGQMLLVVRHGGRVGDEVSQVLSMVLGALLVGYVSAGVVRARRVRTVLAWVVLTLGVIGGFADLVSVDDLGQAGHAVFALAAAAVSLVGLVKFCRSDWYAWQRTRPSAREGASIGQLVVIGVLIGALGGYVGLVGRAHQALQRDRRLILRRVASPVGSATRQMSASGAEGQPQCVVNLSVGKEVVMRQPTLFLTVGLPGTGKTTAARRLEVDHHALRLTKDEWMKALYGEQNPSSASDVIEGRLIEIGLRALELGLNVVIDFGLWGRDERSALRQAATDRGAGVEMHYFEVSAVEQRRRLDQRLTVEPHTTWHISDQELVGWANKMQVPTPGEVDGSEAIDVPPAGFASWDAWRWDRWPPSID